MNKDKIIEILYKAYSENLGYSWVKEQLSDKNEQKVKKYLIDGAGLEELSELFVEKPKTASKGIKINLLDKGLGI